MTLAEFTGNPIVVNLWATWCLPCVCEMPSRHHAQIDRPGVNFVFLNQGEPACTMGAWLQARKLEVRNVLMDGAGKRAPRSSIALSSRRCSSTPTEGW